MTQDQRDAMAIRDREQRARQAPAPAPRASTNFDDMEDDFPF
jgi:hypothetical protein